MSSVKVKYQGHSFQKKKKKTGRCGGIGVSQIHLVSMYAITATETSSPRRFVITITRTFLDATLLDVVIVDVCSSKSVKIIKPVSIGEPVVTVCAKKKKNT